MKSVLEPRERQFDVSWSSIAHQRAAVGNWPHSKVEGKTDKDIK